MTLLKINHYSQRVSCSLLNRPGKLAIAGFLTVHLWCSFDRELLSNEWKDFYWDFTEFWLLKGSEDSGSQTAKDCLKAIVNYGKSLLSEPLASVFEFSLTLRSASPRLVLYRQLAEDSLSSFPLADDFSSTSSNEGDSETNDSIKSKKVEPLLLGVHSRAPNGKCCWVDTGAALFFYANELLSWLENPSNAWVLLYNSDYIPLISTRSSIMLLKIVSSYVNSIAFYWQSHRYISAAWAFSIWSCPSRFKYWKSCCHFIWSSRDELL